jgi:SAM-dependent methyltransferase
VPDVVLRPNAIPVYGFLSFILSRQGESSPLGKKILDCGAGGPLPPLALFHQHGFDAWGIDISAEQLRRAQAFCNERGLDVHLQRGDMRQIPFEDGTFDFVYEQYALCHLTHRDTAAAIGEMRRVLKPGGLCFLGVISRETWPPMGREVEPGEFWADEHGEEVVHSAYTDEEADRLFAGWNVLLKDRRTSWRREYSVEITPDEWLALHEHAPPGQSREDWLALYDTRAVRVQYTHLYYFLQRPV